MVPTLLKWMIWRGFPLFLETPIWVSYADQGYFKTCKKLPPTTWCQAQPLALPSFEEPNHQAMSLQNQPISLCWRSNTDIMIYSRKRMDSRNGHVSFQCRKGSVPGGKRLEETKWEFTNQGSKLTQQSRKNICIFFVGVKTVVWSDNLKELSHNVDVYSYREKREM